MLSWRNTRSNVSFFMSKHMPQRRWRTKKVSLKLGQWIDVDSTTFCPYMFRKITYMRDVHSTARKYDKEKFDINIVRAQRS